MELLNQPSPGSLHCLECIFDFGDRRALDATEAFQNTASIFAKIQSSLEQSMVEKCINPPLILLYWTFHKLNFYHDVKKKVKYLK